MKNLGALANQADKTIVLPGLVEVRERLREKLSEYHARIERYKESNAVDDLGVIIKPDSVLLDSIYKAAIVERLLAEGGVDTGRLRQELNDRFKGYLSEDVYQNAVNVIDDYMRTGGLRTEGGSGFLDESLFTSLIGEAAALVLPRDRAAQAWLTRRYHEYLGRNLAHEQSGESTVDVPALKRDRYKVRILEQLRAHQTVDLHLLAAEIRDEEGATFDRFEFFGAVAGIRELLRAAEAAASAR